MDGNVKIPVCINIEPTEPSGSNENRDSHDEAFSPSQLFKSKYQTDSSINEELDRSIIKNVDKNSSDMTKLLLTKTTEKNDHADDLDNISSRSKRDYSSMTEFGVSEVLEEQFTHTTPEVKVQFPCPELQQSGAVSETAECKEVIPSLNGSDQDPPNDHSALSSSRDSVSPIPMRRSPVANGDTKISSPARSNCLDTKWQQKRSKLHNLLFGRRLSPCFVDTSVGTLLDRDKQTTATPSMKQQHLEENEQSVDMTQTEPQETTSLSQTVAMGTQPSLTTSNASSILQQILTKPQTTQTGTAETSSWLQRPRSNSDVSPWQHRQSGSQTMSNSKSGQNTQLGSSLLQSILTCPINSLDISHNTQSTQNNSPPTPLQTSSHNKKKGKRHINLSSEILKMLQIPTVPYPIQHNLPMSHGSLFLPEDYLEQQHSPAPTHTSTSSTAGWDGDQSQCIDLSAKSFNDTSSNGATSGTSAGTKRLRGGNSYTNGGHWSLDDQPRNMEAEVSIDKGHNSGAGNIFGTKGDKSASVTSQSYKQGSELLETWGNMIERVMVEEICNNQQQTASMISTSARTGTGDRKRRLGNRETEHGTSRSNLTSGAKFAKRANVQHIVDTAIQNALKAPSIHVSAHPTSSAFHYLTQPTISKTDNDPIVMDTLPYENIAMMKTGRSHIQTDIELQKLLSQQVKRELELKTEDKCSLFQCQTCGQRFQHAGTLKVHQRGHNFAEKQYQCDICGKVVTDASYLLIHKRTHRVDASVERKNRQATYECPTCRKIFAQYELYRIHVQTHAGEKLFQCEICQSTFSQSNQLMVHMQIHTGERPFTCPMCHMTFQHIGGLKLHMSTHTDDKPHRLHMSTHADDTPHKLHLSTHSDEKPHKLLLSTHSDDKPHKLNLSTHTDDKVHTCNASMCDKSFEHRVHLDHRRYNTGERLFHCDVCGKIFIDAGKLHKHLQKMHPLKIPFRCDMCEQLFERKADLEEHMKGHASDNVAYTCPLCDKMFLHNESLVLHMITHTDTERTCVCGDRCTTQRELAEHINSHRDIDVPTHVDDSDTQRLVQCSFCHLSVPSSVLKSHIQSRHSDYLDLVKAEGQSWTTALDNSGEGQGHREENEMVTLAAVKESQNKIITMQPLTSGWNCPDLTSTMDQTETALNLTVSAKSSDISQIKMVRPLSDCTGRRNGSENFGVVSDLPGLRNGSENFGTVSDSAGQGYQSESENFGANSHVQIPCLQSEEVADINSEDVGDCVVFDLTIN